MNVSSHCLLSRVPFSIKSRCVMNCLGPAPCGGYGQWVAFYDTMEQCCDAHLYWMNTYDGCSTLPEETEVPTPKPSEQPTASPTTGKPSSSPTQSPTNGVSFFLSLCSVNVPKSHISLPWLLCSQQPGRLRPHQRLQLQALRHLKSLQIR